MTAIPINRDLANNPFNDDPFFRDFEERVRSLSDASERRMKEFRDGGLSRAPHLTSAFPSVATTLPQADFFNARHSGNQFELSLNVAKYRPEELKIKVQNHELTVTGIHRETRNVNDLVMREMTHRYTLPYDVDPATLTSSLRLGVLNIKFLKKPGYGSPALTRREPVAAIQHQEARPKDPVASILTHWGEASPAPLDTSPTGHRPRGMSFGGRGFFDMRNDHEWFDAKLDVREFKPSEITVRTENDELIVTGHHEVKKCEHDICTKESIRKMQLPSDIELSSLTASLSPDRIMTFQARKKYQPHHGKRFIPLRMDK